MSSCLTSAAGGGGGRTCGFNLDIIKSPAAAAAAAATTNTTATTTSTIRRKTHHHHHHYSSSSPSSSSSTIAETADSSNSTISSNIRTSSPLISSSSSSTAAVRKPRTPRKRPNQIYNEAAALLSTAYPNIFSTKNLLINSSSTSSAAKFVKPQTEHYSSSSSLNIDDSSAQLFLPLPFPIVKTSSSSQAVASNYSSNSDSVLSDSNSKPAPSKHEDDDKLPSNNNKQISSVHNASCSLDDEKNDEDFDLVINYDYDLDAESILEEENIEQGRGIDSIIGTTTTGLAVTNDIISSPPAPSQPPAHGNNNNCHGPETTRIEFCCYGYPYPMQMPMPLPVGLGFQVGVGGYGMKTTKCVSAFRTSTTDDGDYWWRFQAVDVGQISPKLRNSSGNSPVSSSDCQNQELGGKKELQKKNNNGGSSKKKKKKMEHSNDNNDNTTAAAKVDGNIEPKMMPAVSVTVPGSSGSNEANSVENYDSNKVMLKLNYDNVIDAWSDRPSPFSDEFPGTDTSSDNAGLSARLAQIDLFGENGGIREASVLRYKEKRRNRLFSKKIRYQVRKVNADQRPRMKGRFVRSPNSIDDRQN